MLVNPVWCRSGEDVLVDGVSVFLWVFEPIPGKGRDLMFLSLPRMKGMEGTFASFKMPMMPKHRANSLSDNFLAGSPHIRLTPLIKPPL